MSEKKRPRRIFLYSMVMALMASFASSAHASVILYGTRVIFPADQTEVTLKISNEGDTPALAQAWLDSGDGRQTPEEIDVPFVIAPSLSRLEPKGHQTLRIIYSGQALPADRESLFWVNVLDIPPKEPSQAQEESSGSLGLAFRTRIKLMYRPKDLPGKPQDAPEQLQWSIGTDGSGRPALSARNPTAYVANLGHVVLEAGGKSFEADTGAVLPGETTRFVFTQPTQGESLPAQWPPGATVVYTSLDDWGATKGHKVELAQ